MKDYRGRGEDEWIENSSNAIEQFEEGESAARPRQIRILTKPIEKLSKTDQKLHQAKDKASLINVNMHLGA